MDRTSGIVRLWRLLRLAAHLARGVATVALALPWAGAGSRTKLIKHWSRDLLSLLGVRAMTHGEPLNDASRNVMVVANHVSWLDIYVLNSVYPVRFISKAEVRTWPVIGWLAEKTGTLFLERGKRRDTVRMNRIVADALAEGGCMALFPEGTTTDGSEIRPFLPSLLQPAIDAGATLRPVAVRYLLANGGIDPAPAYIGDMTLAQSLASILGRREIRADVIFLDPIPCDGAHRRELARQAERVISGALNLAAPRTTPETRADPQASAR